MPICVLSEEFRGLLQALSVPPTVLLTAAYGSGGTAAEACSLRPVAEMNSHPPLAYPNKGKLHLPLSECSTCSFVDHHKIADARPSAAFSQLNAWNPSRTP